MKKGHSKSGVSFFVKILKAILQSRLFLPCRMCLVEHLVTENIQRKCRNYIHKCMLLQEYGCHHDKNGQKQGTAKQQGMPFLLLRF